MIQKSNFGLKKKNLGCLLKLDSQSQVSKILIHWVWGKIQVFVPLISFVVLKHSPKFFDTPGIES